MKIALGWEYKELKRDGDSLWLDDMCSWKTPGGVEMAWGEANGRQLFPSMFLKFHFHSYFYAKEPWTTKETELYLPMQISPMYINPFHCFRFSDICFLPNSDKSQIFFLYRSFISLVLVHSPPDGHLVLIRCQDSQGKVVVQSLSCVWLFAIPWTTACQAFLSFTISPGLLKLMSIGEVRGTHMWVYE